MRDRDEFAHERLPDLPTVGYATRSEKQISDGIMFFMRGIERNRPLLLEIVIGGREQWLRIAGKIWGVRRLLTTDKLDEIYNYFERQAGRDPVGQLRALAALERKH